MQKEKRMSIIFAPFKFTSEALELLKATTMAESSFMFVKQKKLQLIKQALAHLWLGFIFYSKRETLAAMPLGLAAAADGSDSPTPGLAKKGNYSGCIAGAHP
ncbi:hypothetical protein Pint_29988 [Pistacia integerrima]|uniref:Uncharacterized protein n=1 Tax=Pistacia integerrima TaxID=434235 RepID=A0ACC0X0E0_9ROSI|nr:hypothetical protein Pint_29988 [Pistacia integerrima]